MTVIVPEIVPGPALEATKAGVFPEPLAPKPMTVFEFVQAKEAPGGVLIKFETGTVAPAHTAMLAGVDIAGFGFTVTVAVAVSVQLLASVTVTV